MFAQGFPDGQKTVLYVSHQNPSYSYRVDALQENPMTLSVIIPSKRVVLHTHARTHTHAHTRAHTHTCTHKHSIVYRVT